METPEATNRLLHEIKKALPYWEGRNSEWSAWSSEELQEQMVDAMIEKDEEVREAIINLIKTIQDEQTKDSS